VCFKLRRKEANYFTLRHASAMPANRLVIGYSFDIENLGHAF